MTTKKALEELSYDLVDPDPNQPRKIFNEQKLTELANDIGVNGILQAIVVRPHPTAKGRYMIVFGERRFRAAGMVDLETVPCVVRADVNDAQALEWQMAENGQRDDMHPLEEADGYRTMHERDGRDVEEIAELTAKSKAYVYAAMKLCELTAEPRRAFLAGKFDKSVALLIARMPEKLQSEACKAVLTKGAAWQSDDGSTVMSYRAARDYVQRNFMLRLAQAPFKINDETLVPKAGPCNACPKRTGNQRELFADVVDDRNDGGADVCTDPGCYQGKVDAHWSRLAEVAKQRGRTVLEGKQAQGAGSYSDKKYVDLDAPANDLGEYNKSYRQLLGKQADDAVSAVARDERGDVKELVSREELKQHLKEAGVKTRLDTKGAKAGQAAQASELDDRNKLERIVTAAVTDAVLAKIYDAEPMEHARLMARMVVRVCRNDAHKAVMKARELGASKDYGPRATLLAYVGELRDLPDARNLSVELLVAETRGWLDEEARGLGGGDDEETKTNLEDAAELLGVDVKAIVAKARKELAELRDGKAKAKKKADNGAAPAAEATSS